MLSQIAMTFNARLVLALVFSLAALSLAAACRGGADTPEASPTSTTDASTATATPVPILKTVRPAVLAATNVRLSAPSAADIARAKVTQEQANAIARQHWTDGAVGESALANFEDTGLKCLCWVVVRILGHPIFIGGPANIPGDPHPQVLPPLDPADQVHIDAVDAVTGMYMEGAEGGINFRTTTAVPPQP